MIAGPGGSLKASKKKKSRRAPAASKTASPLDYELIKAFFLQRQTAAATAVVGIATLALYTVTLAPDVLSHDSGEWQAAAATLGISHPPGSPAYLLLGYLFTLVPLGTVAARVNFLSAVMGAAGVAALFLFMKLLFGRWLPALVSAASLAFAGLWWSHASVATPYNVVPTLTVVMLIILMRWQENGGCRTIWTGLFLSGLGVTYHPTFVYFLPIFFVGVIVLGPWKRLLKPRAASIAALCLLAGLAPLAYLPVRSAADPPVSYAKIDSPGAFFDYISASDVRDTGHGKLGVPEAGEIKDQFLRVVRDGYHSSYAFLVFGPAVLLFYPAAWSVMRPRRRYLLFMLFALTAHLAVILALSSIYAQYYLPMVLYFSLWSGFSIYLYMSVVVMLTSSRLRTAPVAILAAIYLTFLGLGVYKVWPFVNHADDLAMRRYTDTVFSSADKGAVVLANWESYTGLLYGMEVDGKRQDLQLVAVGVDDWVGVLPTLQAGGRQVLLSWTMPFDDRYSPLVERQAAQYYLSIKGRTYQSYTHGEPYPATVKLLVLRPDAFLQPVN